MAQFRALRSGAVAGVQGLPAAAVGTVLSVARAAWRYTATNGWRTFPLFALGAATATPLVVATQHWLNCYPYTWAQVDAIAGAKRRREDGVAGEQDP